jgi:hypothetical protein
MAPVIGALTALEMPVCFPAPLRRRFPEFCFEKPRKAKPRSANLSPEFHEVKIRKAKPQYGHVFWSFCGAKTPNANRGAICPRKG